jgi:hypothetical protein
VERVSFLLCIVHNLTPNRPHTVSTVPDLASTVESWPRVSYGGKYPGVRDVWMSLAGRRTTEIWGNEPQLTNPVVPRAMASIASFVSFEEDAAVVGIP